MPGSRVSGRAGTVTNYSKPLQLGKYWPVALNPGDTVLFAVGAMQMTEKAVTFIISICATVIGLFLANMSNARMIEKVNRTRRNGSQFSYTRHLPSTVLRIFREYRSSYPIGRLHIYTLAGIALAMVGMIGLAASMISAYQPLVVRITFPADGASFTARANIVVSAETDEINPTVSRVDFYEGDTLLGSTTTPPYSVRWSNVPAGNYSLTAKATDDRGTIRTSDAVSITVNEPANTPR